MRIKNTFLTGILLAGVLISESNGKPPFEKEELKLMKEELINLVKKGMSFGTVQNLGQMV